MEIHSEKQPNTTHSTSLSLSPVRSLAQPNSIDRIVMLFLTTLACKFRRNIFALHRINAFLFDIHMSKLSKYAGRQKLARDSSNGDGGCCIPLELCVFICAGDVSFFRSFAFGCSLYFRLKNGISAHFSDRCSRDIIQRALFILLNGMSSVLYKCTICYIVVEQLLFYISDIVSDMPSHFRKIIILIVFT